MRRELCLLEILLHRVNQAGTTIVMVTHDVSCAAHAQRRIHILDGHLIDLQHERLAPLDVSQLGLAESAAS